jgi:hypothetical protein
MILMRKNTLCFGYFFLILFFNRKKNNMLQALGSRFGTDKADTNDLLHYYESILKKYKYEKINILEIGVFFGSSLKMWREFFPHAEIYGMDHFTGLQGNGHIFEGARKFLNAVHNGEAGTSRIHLVECDQSNRKQLKNARDKFLQDKIEFQFILDDASHLMMPQQLSLAILAPCISKGGMFIMEDWGSSLDIRYSDLKHDFSNSTYTMMKHFNDTRIVRSEYMTKEELEYLQSRIKHPIYLWNQNKKHTAVINF